MTRIRLAVLAVLLLSAVAAAAQTAPACAPAPAEVSALQAAVLCGPVQQTALYTAGGSTCALATQALHGVLSSAAGCSCGFCSRQYVDKACMVIQGGYSVSGYLKYSCQFCPE